MFEKHYPPKEQLDGLYRLLTFLTTDKIFWRSIELSGDTLIVKTEPPKGEFDIRVFYVDEDGRIDDNEFRP